ncbi:MAG: class II aldolase/adducin family protein [Oscillospiraceae bacterium]|nr:class II aldolase/adducin family protein [Oscillospiraceae bacterium]
MGTMGTSDRQPPQAQQLLKEQQFLMEQQLLKEQQFLMEQQLLKELVEMSNRYGGDPRYVLAGGGNSSWKDGDAMYIKASGYSLATIGAAGFTGMDRKKLDELMKKTYDGVGDAAREAAVLSDIMGARLPGYEALRPSVETPLHNLFPYAYVLHLHPALVNGMTCGQGGEEAARGLFGDAMVFVPECKPGFELSKLCGRLIDEYTGRHGAAPKLVFLQNHGVFVAADSVGEIDVIYTDIMGKIGSMVAEAPVGGVEEFLCVADGAIYGASCDAASDAASSVAGGASTTPDSVRLIVDSIMALPSPPSYVYHMTNADIAAFLENEECFQPLGGAFTPDHIVYCRAYFLYVGDRYGLAGQYAGYTVKHGFEPRIICVRGAGAFICTDTAAEADNARALFADAVKVAVYSRSFGGPRHLSPELVDFITHWEIESYRQKIAQTKI